MFSRHFAGAYRYTQGLSYYLCTVLFVLVALDYAVYADYGIDSVTGSVTQNIVTCSAIKSSNVVLSIFSAGRLVVCSRFLAIGGMLLDFKPILFKVTKLKANIHNITNSHQCGSRHYAHEWLAYVGFRFWFHFLKMSLSLICLF